MGLKKPEDCNYVKDYLRLTKGIDEALKISELDPSREEIAIKYQGKYITEDVLRVQTTISNLRFFPPFDSCIEIGAGYGALANQVMKTYNTNKYYVIDYPEILFYVAVWSQIVSPHRKMAIFNGHNHNEVESAELILVPNFLQSEINIEADLLINENSFCEMTEEQTSEYLHSTKLRYKYAYSNNRGRQFMNQNLNDLNTMLTKRFNLSPTLAEYEDYYRDVPAEKRWNVKYIFFASNNADPLPIIMQELHGLTIRTQH